LHLGTGEIGISETRHTAARRACRATPASILNIEERSDSHQI
jgi:hypothetical protein